MKKAPVMGVAALVAAMSLGVAAPAQAQEECVGWGMRPVPASNTVYLENGQLRVNPSGPGQDVADYSAWADPYVDKARACAMGLVPEETWCLVDGAIHIAFNATSYVYQDPETGELVVDYGSPSGTLLGCL